MTMIRSCSCLAAALCVAVTAPLSAQTYRTAAPAALPMVGFASSVVMAGEEIYVGRPGELGAFPMPPMQPGAVTVFSRSADGSWAQTATLTVADVVVGDAFGAALAVEGNLMLVGAPKHANERGAVYVFERTGAQWAHRGRLVPRAAAEGDHVGWAVAVHDGVALVGAPGHGDARGAVFVFRQVEGAWIEAETLGPAAGGSGDRFGASVDLSRDMALVGAPGPHAVLALVGPQPQFRPGAAYVFGRSGSEFREEARLVAADSTAVSQGIAVSLDWTGALVGAPLTRRGVGAVFHFEREGGVWTQTATLAPSQPALSLFGFSMAKGGPDLLIGAPAASNLAGAAFVFRQDRPTGAWSETQRLDIATPTLGASFGQSLAGRNDIALIGAPGGDFFEGTGYLYVKDAATGSWRADRTLVDSDPGLEPIVGGPMDCEGGMVSAFTCSEVDLVSFLPLSALGGKRGIQVNDVWGWTDPDTGKEYAIVGRFDATTFIDMSDPANPVYLGELPLHQGATLNLWRDIKVYANHAFIVSDGAGPHGVQVFDLTQLRNVQGAPVTFSETAHYDRIHSAHNIAINEETGFAFVIGASMGGETCGGGLHMIDIRDPKNPVFAGCFADTNTGNAGTGYSHDAMCTVYRGPDQEHQGKEICFGANENALSIADVTDKANPVALASASYPNVVYAHQGWISEDHKYFFSNDEGDEIAGVAPRSRTLVWDIQDLDDPVLIKEYLGETRATDHNLYVRGPYLYESNYVAGIRIIDVRDPANPREVGYFDTVPHGEDAPGFSGSWSNYPFFQSGNIVVTSMREGVFILKKREERLLP